MSAMRPLLAAALLLAGCGSAPPVGDDGGVPPLDASVPPDLAPPVDLLAPTGPMKLSETGLYADFGARALAPGVIAYTPRYELWSDGATKQRWLWLPPGTKIDTSDMDDWRFPVGTKVWKQFAVANQVIETRLIQKVWDGKDGWWECAYLWDQAGTEATCVPNGLDDALGTTHYVPSQIDCNWCHGNLGDAPIGVSAIQLGSADGKSGMLTQLAAMGLLSAPPAGEPAPPGSGTVQDALGYLHGNCGHCHNQHAWFAPKIHLFMRLAVGDTVPEETQTYKTSIGVKMTHSYPGGIDTAVVPGQPERSQLWVRMGLRDDWAMPPRCTKVADGAGQATVGDWITGLPHDGG